MPLVYTYMSQINFLLFAAVTYVCVYIYGRVQRAIWAKVTYPRNWNGMGSSRCDAVFVDRYLINRASFQAKLRARSVRVIDRRIYGVYALYLAFYLSFEFRDLICRIRN